jgi:predicted DNA-binding protein YlxM (UPF0122 family)
MEEFLSKLYSYENALNLYDKKNKIKDLIVNLDDNIKNKIIELL